MNKLITPLHKLSAWQAALALQKRDLLAVDLMRACLDRVAERDTEVRAFVTLDADQALEQARALDAGPLRGRLHGLPLGVKDLLDTADLPTAYGSPIYAGHQPLADAAAVALCREAGAVVMGKTATTELANMHPTVTRNPLNLAHTPGGSSSGSAAAVADFMLPLALGTQTAGSLIRPAAFCGVVGFKPSHNRVSKAGVKSLSETLDTIGGFARSVQDVALLSAALLGDERLARAAAGMDDATDGSPPRIGLCATPDWHVADADTQQAWTQAEKALSGHAVAVELPAGLGGLVEMQKAVQAFETARSLNHEYMHHPSRLSSTLVALMEVGRHITGGPHARHLQALARQRQLADDLFASHDVLLAPSALGEAPASLETTGDPLFCRGWTWLGLPCVHLPFAKGKSGMPVGLQVVGRYGEDHKLLVMAHWIHQRLMG